MNKIILMGRLTRDPEIRHSQNGGMVASYNLAVDRQGKSAQLQKADFPRCVCIFPKTAEFAEKYLYKGVKVVITGRLQTGSYTNEDGRKIFTTDVVVESQEFAERKSSAPPGRAPENDYMEIPDGIDDELPFE